VKLLIFIHSLSSGGAERVTANLANYWAEKECHVTIVTVTGDESDFYQLHPTIKRIPLQLDKDSQNLWAAITHNYQRIRQLRKILKQQQPDIALAMMTTANILLALAAKGLKIPTVGSEHTHPPMMPLGRIWEWLRQQAYGQLDILTALTKESAEWLKEHTKIQKIEIIPNAINYPITTQSPIIKSKIANDKGFNLIAVGRLSTQKGFDRLILAFSILAPRFPEWNLTILGEGDERQSLEKQRNELGLEQRISIPGVVGNLGDWYAAADLYIMTSLFEGFSNTLCEAMAYGLPVVSVDCDTGPRDIIRHQIDGLLVPQNDHRALVLALETLMTDPSLREEYADRAIEIRERLSMDKIAGMWEGIFEEVMK
jgi:glycosyltransferase involved in cell wall biosynthesis